MTSSASDDQISIKQLAEILNRKENTIRRWEREGVLPKKLVPKRGPRRWRYWTKAQVYGKGGLIEWVRKRDEKLGWEGVLGTPYTPEQKARHIQNLRKPKYLSSQVLTGAKAMADAGKNSVYIVTHFYSRTKYASEINFERALIREFERRGWKYPTEERLVDELRRQEQAGRSQKQRKRRRNNNNNK